MVPLSPPPIEPLIDAGCVWLFTDYDGTLADFVPNPDVVIPIPEVVEIIHRLVNDPHFRVAIVSGRRLSHTHALLPVHGLILAGTYGVELETSDGETHHPKDYDTLRPSLDRIKKTWENAISGKHGFYLEDKGYAIALHARYATENDARQVLTTAESSAESGADPAILKVLDGDRFIEVAPQSADKGKTVRYLLSQFPFEGAVPIYLGDDDKDESGFEAVNEAGGMSIVVAQMQHPTHARYQLENPRQVRRWLGGLADKLQEKSGG